MKRYSQISAFILSGGASSRMGSEKGLLEFGGEPLIVRTAHLLEPLVAAITVVGSPEHYRALGLHAIADRDFSCVDDQGGFPGPLVGIASALTETDTIWNLILACDLPYLTTEWLDWLLARAMLSSQQIVMPCTSKGLEPLAAVYRRECALPIVASLGRGVRKVTDAVQDFRTELVSEHEWRDIDPGGKILRNMNTQADYQEARRWLETR
jgi:molybdopterin-guanine dinucleotide biosynthesis protein A